MTGIAAGAIAAILAFVYVSGIRSEALSVREGVLDEYGGDIVEVLVATKDIEVGKIIATEDIGRMTWVADLLPGNVCVDEGDVVGKAAGSVIYKNEPINGQRLGNRGQNLEIPENLVAVTVPSADVSAVGGALNPGSVVNAYSEAGGKSRLLGQDILVLETSCSRADAASEASIFGSGGSGKGSISWITLAVTPASVEQLINASKGGGLYFTLPSRGASSVGGVG
jgi:pilus assembly protein CpaB